MIKAFILLLPCIIYEIFIYQNPLLPIDQSSPWLLSWYYGALIPEQVIENHQYQRYFLASLLHHNLKHLFSNLIPLFLLAYYAMHRFKLKLSALWVLVYGSSILGFVILTFRENVWTNGLSGGLYALLAWVLLSALSKIRALMILLILTLVQVGPVDILNHVLGSIFGVIFFYVDRYRVWGYLSIMIVMAQALVMHQMYHDQIMPLDQGYFIWTDPEHECERISEDRRFDGKWTNSLFYLCRFDQKRNEQHSIDVKEMKPYDSLFVFSIAIKNREFLVISRIPLSLTHQQANLQPWEKGIFLKLLNESHLN